MEDTEIIGLFFERSQTALRQLTVKYGRLCEKIARNILGNAQDAEEICNDVLTRLWEVIPPERPENLKAYVGRITRNMAINRAESINAKKRGGEYVNVSAEWLESFPEDGEINLSVELKDVFERFLDTLGQDDRNIFVRRYWFMEPVKDIAVFYALSESKVKSSLFRTRQKMKDYLIKEGITA